jgi:multiple sugar transport system permease protein
MKPTLLVKPVIRYFLILVAMGFSVFPIYWMVLTAFKRSQDWFAWPPVFFPQSLTLSSFIGSGYNVYVTTSLVNIAPYLRNSIVVSLATAGISTIIATFTAYSISRFKTGGINFVNWILSVRMTPPIAVAIPVFVLFSTLGLVNTWLALIMIYLVFATSFSTWVLIAFFNDIPRELDDSALVDGASLFQTFWKVILPLSLPGLAAVFTLSLLNAWSEFLFALVLTSNANAQTLPVYIGRYITGFEIAWGPISAAGIVSMLPVTILSFVMLRYVVTGLTLGAVKG